MQLGSPLFEAYNRTLRRVMWADVVDEQRRVARVQNYRASLIEQSYEPAPSLVAALLTVRQHDSEGTR